MNIPLKSFQRGGDVTFFYSFHTLKSLKIDFTFEKL